MLAIINCRIRPERRSLLWCWARPVSGSKVSCMLSDKRRTSQFVSSELDPTPSRDQLLLLMWLQRRQRCRPVAAECAFQQTRYSVAWRTRQRQTVDGSACVSSTALSRWLCDVVITRCRCAVTSSVMTTRRKQSRPQRCCRHCRG